MKLSDIGGYYNPSFFNMVLETDENIEVAINKYSATFVHEFIHYIQDIILPYNIRVNLSRLLWFSDIQQFAHQNGYIVKPFKDWSDEAKTTLLQFNMSIGKNPGKSQFVNTVKNMENAFVSYEEASGFDGAYSKQYRQFKIYKYSVCVNGKDTYNLGARDLMEYIAYKIETKHFKTKMRLPQLPYESIDLLFAHYGLSHVSDEIRLCVAEVCLYNDNPIRFLFLNFLENEEFKQGVKTLSYEEIYNKFLLLEFESVDGVKETIKHKTNRRLTQFENTLSKHYANFTGIKEWIERVNNFAETELSTRFIFSDLYKLDTRAFMDMISWIIGKIGLPLVMNNKEECVSLQSYQDNIEEFVQFYILQRFFGHVSTTAKMNSICPIYRFCKVNGNVSDIQCNTDLQIENIESKQCPYYRFLKSYGLLNIEIR